MSFDAMPGGALRHAANTLGQFDRAGRPQARAWLQARRAHQG